MDRCRSAKQSLFILAMLLPLVGCPLVQHGAMVLLESSRKPLPSSPPAATLDSRALYDFELKATIQDTSNLLLDTEKHGLLLKMAASGASASEDPGASDSIIACSIEDETGQVALPFSFFALKGSASPVMFSLMMFINTDGNAAFDPARDKLEEIVTNFYYKDDLIYDLRSNQALAFDLKVPAIHSPYDLGVVHF